MHAENAQMIAERPRGGKARLLTLADLDRRTRAAQDALDLRDRLVSDLGGPTHVTAAEAELVDTAALMGAMLRDAGARYITGQPVDLAEYTTLANCQRRVLQTLGLQRRTRDTTPTLSDYLARRRTAEGDGDGEEVA